MSKYVHSKKRVLGICKLQGKLAQRDYLGAEKNIAKLEMSREQLAMMADEMLDTSDCIQSGMLAAKLEFGHRLINLTGLQKAKIVQSRRAATMLQSKAHLSARREERAELDFRQATKSSEYHRQQSQPIQMKYARSGKKPKKGMTA
tara:strand:+ start:242 stop:679 length:438 start_codon:yes stop_codon:yes gene_type:complete